LDQDSDFPGYDPSDQLMLLSSQILAHFANGRLSLKANPRGATSNSVSLLVTQLGFSNSTRPNTLLK
jgi:hypothetical protein